MFLFLFFYGAWDRGRRRGGERGTGRNGLLEVRENDTVNRYSYRLRYTARSGDGKKRANRTKQKHTETRHAHDMVRCTHGVDRTLRDSRRQAEARTSRPSSRAAARAGRCGSARPSSRSSRSRCTRSQSMRWAPSSAPSPGWPRRRSPLGARTPRRALGGRPAEGRQLAGSPPVLSLC